MNETLNSGRPYRFILSGGGTGGHLFPAIAIANKIKSLYPDAAILFVGALGKIEMEKVPLSGFPVKGLWISGFQRKDMLKNLSLPFKLTYSFARSWLIIRKFRPDAAIGTGGYASFPLLFVASKLKIPTLVQEQNFFPGVSNKMLAKTADRICVAFRGMEKYFPAGKIVITGNPVREDIRLVPEQKEKFCQAFGLEPVKKTLLLIGGSLGARVLNEAMLQSVERLLENNIQVIWQAGRYHEELAGNPALKDKKGLWTGAFINDMTAAYNVADLVVSRAGAISISELAVMKSACILVPSPNVTADHQTKNAMALVEKEAALLVKDQEAVGSLGKLILDTIRDEAKLESLRKNIGSFAYGQATADIVREIISLIQKK